MSLQLQACWNFLPYIACNMKRQRLVRRKISKLKLAIGGGNTHVSSIYVYKWWQLRGEKRNRKQPSREKGNRSCWH